MPELTYDDATQGLREALASRSGTAPEDWFPVFKARYGMKVAFAAMREAHGDGRVITQLFTCCTAVDPIIAAGLTPTYAEVQPRNLMLDPSALGQTGDVRAVMMQHTFGIIDVASSRSLAERVRQTPALLVEDSAHCVCRMATDEGGRPLADVSVHSFGVEKMLPTHFGGAVWINPEMRDRGLSLAMRDVLSSLPVIDDRLAKAAREYLNQNRVLNRLPAAAAGALRARMISRGRLEPAIAPVELRGGLAYEPMLPSEWICRQASRGIEALDANEGTRRGIVGLYREALSGVPGISIPDAVLEGDPQPLLRFPLFARDTVSAERIISAVRAAGAFAERWYRPALFPGVETPEAYGVHDGLGLDVTSRLIAGAACLPTELSEGQAELAAKAVEKAVGLVDSRQDATEGGEL